MSTRAPSILAVALGQIRYRLALAVIGFGVFMGWLLACVLPLCLYASYFDDDAGISETSSWAITISFFMIIACLTFRCRGWIIRKALEEAPPQPVNFWTGEGIVKAGLESIQLALVGLANLVGLLIIVIVGALLLYGGYLLITMLSVPMAILIGAIIIALAILIAASL